MLQAWNSTWKNPTAPLLWATRNSAATKTCWLPSIPFTNPIKSSSAPPALSKNSPKPFPKSEKPAAYICTGTACKPPTSDPEKVREYLRN